MLPLRGKGGKAPPFLNGCLLIPAIPAGSQAIIHHFQDLFQSHSAAALGQQAIAGAQPLAQCLRRFLAGLAVQHPGTPRRCASFAVSCEAGP